jgi:tetratricopeptide (TPR) repeat protein
MKGCLFLIAQVEPPQNKEGGDYYYRTLAPGVAMAEEEGVYVVNLTNVHRNKEEIMREADVLVLKNVCDPDLLLLILERKALKRLTVFEFADDINAVQPWSPVYSFYRNPDNFGLSKRLACLSDVLQFTVGELRRIYGHLNPVNILFSNQVAIIPPERPTRNNNRLVIGWGGSHGHLEDNAEIAPVLIKWMGARNDAELYLMCSDPIWDLFRDIPEDWKRRVNPGSIEDYYSFLETLDIGITPLKDTAFYRSRSDVKFLEYAVSGVVAVVQELAPYRTVVQEGKTGFFFQHHDDLISILNKLVDDRDLIRRMAKEARSYLIKERLQKNHALDRIDFYREQLSKVGWHCGQGNGTEAVYEKFSRLVGASRKGRYLSLVPTRFELLLHDGLVLAQVDRDHGRAQTCFAEAARLEPQNYLPYLFGANSFPDAATLLEQALLLNPRSVKAQILLGECHAREGRAFAALQSFEEAANIFPQYEVPYVRVSAVLAAMGEEAAAHDISRRTQALMIQ